MFVSVGMGFDLKTSIVVSDAVMLLYTFMGGLWAVVVTDFVQFIILTLGVMTLFPLVFAERGLSALTEGTPAGFLTPINEPFSLPITFSFRLVGPSGFFTISVRPRTV